MQFFQYTFNPSRTRSKLRCESRDHPSRTSGTVTLNLFQGLYTLICQLLQIPGSSPRMTAFFYPGMTVFFTRMVAGYLFRYSTTSWPIFFVPTSLPAAFTWSREEPAMSPVLQPSVSTRSTAASIALASVSRPKL